MATLKYKDSQGNYRPVIGYNVTYENEVVQTTGTSTTAVMSQDAVTDALADKQDVLVSSTTIKTVNGNSLLGSGNIEIDGGTTGELITISLTTNQDSTYNDDLIGATITVTDNTESTTLYTATWDGTPVDFEIPVPVNYTVSVSAVSGYQTPASVTYNSRTGRSRNITFQYNTEIVTVTVNTNVSGVSTEGQVVTINGVNTTVPASGVVSQKVAYGVNYSVSVNGKRMYNPPATQSFTANNVTRSVTMTYTKITNGIYAVTTTGDLIGQSYINTSSPSSYVGVAILDTSKNMAFMIDKRFPTGSSAAANIATCKAWSAALLNKELSYGPSLNILPSNSTELRAAATNQYNNGYTGFYITNNIVNDSRCASENASNNAAKYCRSVANPITGSYDGYLFSVAEAFVVLDNISTINDILSKIGGTAINAWMSGQVYGSDLYYTYLWTSTSFNYGAAYTLHHQSNSSMDIITQTRPSGPRSNSAIVCFPL